MTELHPGAVALDRLMKERGLGQTRLAKDMAEAGLGLAQSTLSYILSGKHPPDMTTARKLGTFFAVPAITFIPELAELVPPSGDPRIKRLPLDDLVLAKGNERTTYIEDGIDDLAHQIIDAETLYQNLLGYPEDDKVAVWDGGRRWRALRRAREWGKLPPVLAEFGIPVLLLEDRVACMKATIAANQKEDTHFLDRAAALARLQDETGWKASRLARETGYGKERLVQQLLQIHRNLPDWARERAYLPKDDPQHLKFRDCRDMVEQVKAPEQKKGEDVPLPLAVPEPRPIRFTKEQVKEAFLSMATVPPAPEKPIAERVTWIIAKHSKLGALLPPGITRDTLLADVLSADGMAAVAGAVRDEFGVVLLADDVAAAKTSAGLIRAVINAPRYPTQQQQQQQQPPPRTVAITGTVPLTGLKLPNHFAGVAMEFCDGKLVQITLRHEQSGADHHFIPAQRDITDSDETHPVREE